VPKKALVTGGSKVERPVNVREHTYTKSQTHHHAASGWRIHRGVEVTESSTNKQHTLSITHLQQKPLDNLFDPFVEITIVFVCDRLCLVLVCRGRYGLGGGFLLFILGSSVGGVAIQPRMVRTFLEVHTRPRLAYALRCRGY
jgi:hypothetical protein